MTAPAKYLFDADFGASRAQTSDATGKIAAEAEARGYRAGHAAAMAEAANRQTAALERIANGIGGLTGDLRAIEGRLEAEAVEVAVAVARKLAPQLIAQEPFAELTALIAECFSQLVGVPHVVVRINDALYERAREDIEGIARARGLEGRLVVMAESEIEPGDCRIEWADGGVARDRARTEAAILETVNNYVAVRRGRRDPLLSGDLRHE